MGPLINVGISAVGLAAGGAATLISKSSLTPKEGIAVVTAFAAVQISLPHINEQIIKPNIPESLKSVSETVSSLGGFLGGCTAAYYTSKVIGKPLLPLTALAFGGTTAVLACLGTGVLIVSIDLIGKNLE